MTLREFLQSNGLNLERKMESRIGEVVSDEYRIKFHKSPPKIFSEEMDVFLNDYTLDFLSSCSNIIIKILNPKHEPIHG